MKFQRQAAIIDLITNHEIDTQEELTARLREMVSRLLVQFASQREFQQVTAYADPNPYRIL